MGNPSVALRRQLPLKGEPLFYRKLVESLPFKGDKVNWPFRAKRGHPGVGAEPARRRGLSKQNLLFNLRRNFEWNYNWFLDAPMATSAFWS